MSAPRWAIAAAAAFVASIASHPQRATPRRVTQAPPPAARAPALPALPARAWPPPVLEAEGPAPADVRARLEPQADGSARLVVEREGSFVHLAYGDVAGAGAGYATLSLRQPAARADGAAPGPVMDDVALWESTDPFTLRTTRGTVRFRLAAPGETAPDPLLRASAPPTPAGRRTSVAYDCLAHDDAAAGYAVVCRFTRLASTPRAAVLTDERPRDRAWTWAPPPRKGQTSHFVRLDLPLSPGSAAAGVIGFTRGGLGVVLRADALWAAASEPSSLLLDEAARSQPASPFSGF